MESDSPLDSSVTESVSLSPSLEYSRLPERCGRSWNEVFNVSSVRREAVALEFVECSEGAGLITGPAPAGAGLETVLGGETVDAGLAPAWNGMLPLWLGLELFW